MTQTTFDSLIFDMDGTLWDAVDSYAEIWNRTIDQLDVRRQPVVRDELVEQMGRKICDICDSIIPDPELDREKFLALLAYNEETMMPELGGRLYTGVKETIATLSKRYKLFLVSNCGDMGLINFMRFTGLEPYITDTLTYGETLLGKAENIATVVERNGLKNPLYIGDTQSDCDAAHKAGVAFGHVTYGFGLASNPEISFDSFPEIAQKL